MPNAWDTTVTSRVHGEGRHASLLSAHIAGSQTVVLPAPAVQEIARGIYVRAARDRRFVRRLGHFLEFLAHPLVHVMSFDGDAALLAARLLSHLPHPPTGRHRRQGSRAQQRAAWALDVQIAACAFAGGYGILTENVADFAVLRDAIATLVPDVPPLVVSDARESVAAT